jgi:NADPH:quinone reductase-like Zn-dependent oxidoreductase
LAPFGRLVTYGAASGELPALAVHHLFGMHSVAGFGIMDWRRVRPDQARQEMVEVAEHVAEGRLRTAVHATLPITEAAKAHALLEDRGRLGRVLLVP